MVDFGIMEFTMVTRKCRVSGCGKSITGKNVLLAA